MSRTTPTLKDRQQAALAEARLITPTPVPGAPAAPDDPLAALQALCREPAEKAEATAEALRAELRALHDRIVPEVLVALRAFRGTHAARLNALRVLDYHALRVALPPTSMLSQQLATAVDEARLAFAPSPHPEGGGAVIDELERFAGRIARLEATDAHACPAEPPGCGCRIGNLRALIVNAAAWPGHFARRLAYAEDLVLRIQRATRGSERATLEPARHDPTPAPVPAFDPFR